MSNLFALAAGQWKSMRAEFEIIREVRYRAAEEATNGYLLNARGAKAGIDPYSLFIGSDLRAYAYASDELIEHWEKHPRLTVARFERESLEQWGAPE